MKLLFGLFLLLIGIGILDMLSTKESKKEIIYYESEAYREIKRLDSLDHVQDTLNCNCYGN